MTLDELAVLLADATGLPVYQPGHTSNSLPSIQLNAVNLDPSNGGRGVFWDGEVVVAVHHDPPESQYAALLPYVEQAWAAMVAEGGIMFDPSNAFDAGELPAPWIGHRISISFPLLDLCSDGAGGGGGPGPIGSPPDTPSYCDVEDEDEADPPFQIECEQVSDVELYEWQGERDSIVMKMLDPTPLPFTDTSGLDPGTWRFRAKATNSHGESDWSPWSNYTEVP